MGTSVHVKEAHLVTPFDSTPSHVLPLSALDSQTFLRFTIEYLLIFAPCVDLHRVTIVARVKTALARTLVRYYPLAGRVRVRPDGMGLEVACRAQGAVLVEAVSDQATTNDFKRAPRHVTQWRKFLSLQVSDVLKGAPALVVQLTWLKDGGAAIGVGMNHCICDGIGSAEFLNCFAELTRGELGSELKPWPVWDRHLMDPKGVGPAKANTKLSRVNPMQSTHPEFDRVPDICGFVSRFLNETLVPTSLVYDRTTTRALKELANSTGRRSESTPYTSFEVLCAHTWRSWARAMNLPSNQILKLLFSVNIRDRVRPSLPSGYYGNAFVLGCAQASVKNLTEKGLGYACAMIKRAKDRVDTEYVRSVINSVSDMKASVDSVGVLIVSQWSRLGLDKVDFGMGRPVHVGPICCDRYCLLLPVFDQTDAVKVMVALPATAVDRYEYLARNPNT